MSWTDDVKEIERQRRMAEEMGGADSVAFQHGRGKLTVLERIDLLADPGTFHEIGALAGTAIFTLPPVASRTFEQIGRTYLPGNSGTDVSTKLLQAVPVVSAVLGSVAGLPAVQACLCHFSVMVKGTSQVFVAGPKVVEQATGQRITKEQVRNGVVMNLAENEADAIGQVRRFLSYLPSSVWEAPPEVTSDDDPDRRAESLLSVVPRDRRRTYDPHEIVGAVVAKGLSGLR